MPKAYFTCIVHKNIYLKIKISFKLMQKCVDVFQVTRDSHLYLKDIESREEGGTPGIIESIRAGMVFQLKEVRNFAFIRIYH